MNKEDYKVQIDKWLRNIGRAAKRKVWVVVFSLDLEWQLRDASDFNIPLVKLLSNPLVNKEDLTAILTSLYSKGVLSVNRYLGEWEKSEDPDDPQGQKLATIEFYPNIVDYPDTKIRIVREKFNYLKEKLNKIAKQYANQSQSYMKKPEWRDSFKLDGEDFIFGDYGKINFKSKDTKYLFKQLFDARGGWVTIQKLTENKNTNYTRSTIKQIEKRMGVNLKKHIDIPSTRGDDLEPKPSQGAYRLRFIEQPK